MLGSRKTGSFYTVAVAILHIHQTAYCNTSKQLPCCFLVFCLNLWPGQIKSQRITERSRILIERNLQKFSERVEIAYNKLLEKSHVLNLNIYILKLINDQCYSVNEKCRKMFCNFQRERIRYKSLKNTDSTKAMCQFN